MNTMLQTRTLRKVAAIFYSGFVQVGFVLFSMATLWDRVVPSTIVELTALAVLISSFVGASLILERSAADRFWKSYLFSCFAGFLPFCVFCLVQAFLQSGIGGYAWFGIMLVTMVLVAAALFSLPFAGLFYWARGREVAYR